MTDSDDFSTILPGVGVAGIRLGMTRDQVRAIMGEPAEISTDDFPDDSESITLNYPDHGLSFDFGSDNDYVLDTIRTERSDIRLFDQCIGGLSVEAALSLFESRSHFPDPDPLAFADDDGNRVEAHDFDGLSLTLWFVNGALDAVQIGTFWKDDDTPVFPALSGR